MKKNPIMNEEFKLLLKNNNNNNNEEFKPLPMQLFFFFGAFQLDFRQ